MRPVWLLDVDGVINAFNHQPQYRAIWVPAIGQEWKIRYSPLVVAAITGLSEVVDIQWCTTWGEEAARELAPRLGLPEFPVVPPKDYDAGDTDSSGDLWWKYRRFLSARATGADVIWTDDDIPDDLLARHKAESNSFIVRPHPNRGLTLKDLDVIRTWVSVGGNYEDS